MSLAHDVANPHECCLDLWIQDRCASPSDDSDVFCRSHRRDRSSLWSRRSNPIVYAARCLGLRHLWRQHAHPRHPPRGSLHMTLVTLDDIDIANPDVYLGGVPHEQFAFLRRKAPVRWHHKVNGPGFWALTRHEDIARVVRDTATFSQSPSLFIEDLPAGDLRASPDLMQARTALYRRGKSASRHGPDALRCFPCLQRRHGRCLWPSRWAARAPPA